MRKALLGLAALCVGYASPATATVLVWGGSPYVGQGQWGGCIYNQCFTVRGLGNWRRTFF